MPHEPWHTPVVGDSRDNLRVRVRREDGSWFAPGLNLDWSAYGLGDWLQGMPVYDALNQLYLTVNPFQLGGPGWEIGFYHETLGPLVTQGPVDLPAELVSAIRALEGLDAPSEPREPAPAPSESEEPEGPIAGARSGRKREWGKAVAFHKGRQVSWP